MWNADEAQIHKRDDFSVFGENASAKELGEL